MKEFNNVIGATGEKQAEEFLKKKGYKILTKNFRCVVGEIDLIAKQKDMVIFIEVKKRETYLFGNPAEAVGKMKQSKIRKAALYYLKQYKLIDSPCRFDVIEIVGENINHIENAF